MFPIKKNLFSIIAIFVLILGLIFSLLFLSSTLKVKAHTRKQMDMQIARINKFKRSRQGPPSREMVSYWRKRYETLQHDFQQTVDIFNKPASTMPQDVPEPLEFKAIFLEKQEKLRKQALQAGLSLPSSLGFEYLRDTIPEEKEIPVIAKQQEILERLVNLMTQSGILSLTKISFSLPVDVKVNASDKTPFYRDFGITLSLVGETQKIVKFLHQLEVDDYIFVVNTLTIEETKVEAGREDKFLKEEWTQAENLVKANLQISTYVFLFDFNRGEKGES